MYYQVLVVQMEFKVDEQLFSHKSLSTVKTQQSSEYKHQVELQLDSVQARENNSVVG